MSRASILLSLAMLCGVLGVNVAFAETPQWEDYSPLTSKANQANAADLGSTAVGLALGATEANPLGAAAIPLKFWALHEAKQLPIADRVEAEAQISAMWGGAAANNVCVVLAIVSGGTFAPLCVVAGIAWGVADWHKTADARGRAQICQGIRTYRNEPRYDCRAIFAGTETPQWREWGAGFMCNAVRFKQPGADCSAWTAEWQRRVDEKRELLTMDEQERGVGL